MIVLLLLLLLLAVQLSLAARSCAELQHNCTVCAAEAACVWCTTARSVGDAEPEISSVCVTRIENDSSPGCVVGTRRSGANEVVSVSTGRCTRLDQLPCYGAAPGDVCSPSVPLERINPYSGGNVTLRGRIFYGNFTTPTAGVRNALPETMCLPDGRLGKLGECTCRNFTELDALAHRVCVAPPQDKLLFDAKRDSQLACTALTAYRSCLARTVGYACFTERFDRICAALDHTRLAALGCRACNSLHHQSTTTFLLSQDAPECLVAQTSVTAPPQCARPFYFNFVSRKHPCNSTGSQQRPVFDHAFASWLHGRMERNSVVLQVGYRQYSCLALFMASAGRFRWIVTTPDSDAEPPVGWSPFDPDAPLRAQFMTGEQRNTTATERRFALDWLLALELGAVLRKDSLLGPLLDRHVPLLERCRFGAMLGTDGVSTERQQLLIDEMLARDFVYDFDLTRRARSAAVLLKTGVLVFLRRQLAARVQFPAFLRANVSDVRWNQQIPFGSTWLRVYVPRGIVWTGNRVVISIHSDPRYVEWRSSVRETWLTRARRLGMLAIFIVCNPDAAVLAEADAYNDIIVIEAPYMYHAERSVLPLLEHVWFQLAARHAVDAHWVMKTDHDTVVFPDNLQRFLRNQTADPLSAYVYAGVLFEVAPVRDPKHHSSVSALAYPPLQYPGFMSGGAGYVESMALVRCLTAHTSTAAFNYFPRSDVGMRLAINEAACQPLVIVNSNNFHYNAPPIVPANTVTMHYVKNAEKLRDYWAPQLALLSHSNKPGR